tara:strand:- start:163 stop:315 length:153 start_codon:yes stop_codon:yes gene_type:complete
MFNGPNGAGKGDKPRPMSISKTEYDKRWKKIFNKHRLEKAGIKDGSRKRH